LTPTGGATNRVYNSETNSSSSSTIPESKP
jgi:hypothetical protein